MDIEESSFHDGVASNMVDGMRFEVDNNSMVLLWKRRKKKKRKWNVYILHTYVLWFIYTYRKLRKIVGVMW